MLLETLALKLAPLDLKCGVADFPLIGMRAAPDYKVILRSLEQNLAWGRGRSPDKELSLRAEFIWD